MKVHGKHYRTIWLHPSDPNIVQIIDQRHLPHRFVIEDLTTVEEVARAIKDMHVRGAGLIGATAGFGYLSLEAALPTRFALASGELARPWLLVRNRLVISRKSLRLVRELAEIWRIPIESTGDIGWDAAEILEAQPELFADPPEGMTFPAAAPPRLGSQIRKVERLFVAWRARNAVDALANPGLDLVADEGEDREAFIERCLAVADRADDATQDRVRARFEKKVKTLKTRLDRERDELERDRQRVASRKAEEKLGLVEGLFSVLLGSRSVRSASRKAASKIRSAAGKRRMRQTAEGSVTESVHEIERLEVELDDVADEMQDEIDRIAEESERLAKKVEIVRIRPIQRDIEVTDLWMVWS